MKCIRCMGNASPGDFFCSACRTEMIVLAPKSTIISEINKSVKEREESTFRDKVENKYGKELDRYDSSVEQMARAKADAQASSLDKFQHAKNHAIRLKLEQIEDLLVQIKSLL